MEQAASVTLTASHVPRFLKQKESQKHIALESSEGSLPCLYTRNAYVKAMVLTWGLGEGRTVPVSYPSAITQLLTLFKI